MLILRRRAGQSILIGPDVEIQIIEVGPTQVKIGIVAPGQVAVQRKEVAITRERNLTAARGLGRDGLATFLERLGAGRDSFDSGRQNPDSTVRIPDSSSGK